VTFEPMMDLARLHEPGVGARRRAKRSMTAMAASTLHVEPNRKGRWIVRRDDERESLSEHETATEAQRTASEIANDEGTSLVLLRDRYGRTHHVRSKASDPPWRTSP
jgi:hypothetical protein